MTPLGEFGICRRVTYKGKGGFGKVSDRVKAKDLRPQEILGGVVGCPVNGREPSKRKAIMGFPDSLPSALLRR